MNKDEVITLFAPAAKKAKVFLSSPYDEDACGDLLAEFQSLEEQLDTAIKQKKIKSIEATTLATIIKKFPPEVNKKLLEYLPVILQLVAIEKPTKKKR